MKAVFGAILALGISSCGPAYAAETPSACQSQQTVIDNVVNGSKSEGFTVKVHAILSGESLPALVQAINAAPPPSNFVADLAVVFEAKTAGGQDDPRNLVVLFKDGCKIAAMMVPHEIYEKVVGSPA